MALRFIRRTLLTLGILLFLATPSAIYSCGPFLESAIFAFDDRPDGPAEDFAAGKLGIVRPGFRRAYQAVAYRYLSDLKLSNEQQKAVLDMWSRKVEPEHASEEDAAANWGKARSEIPDVPPPPVFSPYAVISGDQPYSKYVNCPSDAFQNAIKTLEDRAAKFGATSATLREWIFGQDQVFSNCSGEVHVIPAVISAGDSSLRADRAYQIAAAHFYARDFDEAIKQFEAIKNDRNSPWAGISGYLAARALIRKANLVHKDSEQFDRTAMAAAQEQLEGIVGDPNAGPIHEPAVRLLNFVRFRTEPAKRLAELDHVMLEQNPGQNFKQDLWDYVLLLSQGLQADDPSDWLQTFAALGGYPYHEAVEHRQPESDAAKHSIARWHETRSLPWLIAALAGTKADSPDLQPLLAAARQVPGSSRAYLTIRYYATRLMIASGQPDTARTELDTLLGRKDLDIPLGSHNLLNEERLKLTTSLEDFLQHAPETPVPAELDFNTGEWVPASPNEPKPGEPALNHYAAEVFLKRLPLATLIQAAAAPTLPKQLRRDLARGVWVRAILLDDLGAASKLQAALQETDPPLWKGMDLFRAAQSEAEQHFVAIFIILSNPGMKPSAREGLARSTTLGELDSYHDNWWCADLDPGSNWGKSYGGFDKNINLNFVEHDPDFPFPNWLTGPQKVEATSEWKTLSAVGTAPNYLTRQVLAYGEQHRQDPRVPQALYLAIRSTRFGCTNIETSKLSKAAFDFLHEHYPESEWAKKTKYYY